VILMEMPLSSGRSLRVSQRLQTMSATAAGFAESGRPCLPGTGFAVQTAAEPGQLSDGPADAVSCPA
jgi:hypothetical protein